MAGGAIRGAPNAAARCGLPDAGLSSEADDAVQEAWLRLSRADTSEVENLDGWLTTVVARVSLNMLRSRKGRREEPIGVRVPEPIIDRADGMNPEHEALLADSVGLALLVVLETLSPAERLAFVLHDIFAVPFDEIAPIVDRSPEAARQLASRARRRVRGETRSPTPTSRPSARSSTRLPRLRATATSKRCSRCWTRTSCCARISAPRASRGRPRRPPRRGAGPFYARQGLVIKPALVNGTAGAVSILDGEPFAVGGITVRGGKIVELDILADPERLRRLDLTILDD